MVAIATIILLFAVLQKSKSDVLDFSKCTK